MYRVLKVRNFAYTTFPVFHSKIQIPRWIRLRCCLCHKVTDHPVLGGPALILSSAYSTGVPVQILNNEQKKKRHWRKAKFAELLEVSEHNTSERKTKIKTLRANTLHMIQDEFVSTSCDLNISSDLEVFAAIDENEASQTIPELCHLDDHVHEELMSEPLNEEATDNVPFVDISQTKRYEKLNISKENKEKLVRTNLTDLEKAGKEKSLNTSLASYVELCINCGFLNRGWLTIQYYLNKKNMIIPITDVRIFNILFEGCAKRGHFDKLIEIWNAMTEATHINPDAVSYARRFETIVRSTKKDKSELLHACMRMLEEQGLSLDDIFLTTDWKRDSREVVLSAIKAVRPNYIPKIILPDTKYSCPLVDHLNQPPVNPLKSPSESIFTFDELKKFAKDQFESEKKTYVKVVSIEKPPEITDCIKFSRDQLENLESSWDKTIYNALKRDISAMCSITKSQQRGGNLINIYPYLAVLQPSEYVDIIKHEIRKLGMGSETYSPTSAYLCRDLGNLVKLRYDIKVKSDDGVLQKVQQLYDHYIKWYLNPSDENASYNNGRHTWQMICSKYQDGPTMDTLCEPWPNNVLLAVGKFLYNIILKDVKINVNVLKMNSKEEHHLPAFYTVFRYQSNVTNEEVKPHPVLSRLYKTSCISHLVFPASELPMLSPPLPWSSTRSGGYLVARAPIIRLSSTAIGQRERLKEAPPNQLYPCLDSLNQLGSIPWRVNTNVLDIVINIFNSGGHDKLSIPPPPISIPPSPVLSEDATKVEKYEVFRARMQVRRKRAEMHSLWCDALYRLSLANHYRDKTFWLPHNMDFRGRVYPCPPHLSHLGSDLYRSLLVFAQKQPLGPKGLDWLKIHAINLTGCKKRSPISERLAYANEILPKILDSANNPMKEGAWWQESEEPWQTLATSFEIRDALNELSGPDKFLSSFPIHQDGSCNGLQHYAALGRDASGAASVNLAPFDAPQDVYSCVAAIVDRERAKDAANGVEVAKVLEGFVRRKVVKQTVMTTVYGVTRYGARLQIAKQLKDIDDFPVQHIWAASSYLVVKTFDSIREMFTSTREIQDWFTEAAQLISGVRGESVEYVTPLGLPVVQPYSRWANPKNNSKSPEKVSYLHKFDKFERPNVMKQKNAFPPNFIHSLDSTHMMLTSIHCQRAGITFVSVHDCFWTHPASVDVMNKICREQFVALHSEPILQDLSEYMLKRYGYTDISDESGTTPVDTMKTSLNKVLKRYPERGNFEIEDVLKSVYFFS